MVFILPRIYRKTLIFQLQNGVSLVQNIWADRHACIRVPYLLPVCPIFFFVPESSHLLQLFNPLEPCPFICIPSIKQKKILQRKNTVNAKDCSICFHWLMCFTGKSRVKIQMFGFSSISSRVRIKKLRYCAGNLKSVSREECRKNIENLQSYLLLTCKFFSKLRTNGKEYFDDKMNTELFQLMAAL